MYRVLGSDGNEYAPVSAEVLRQWIAEGRACARTSVQLEGSTEWQSLGSVPEFAAALAAMPAGPIVQTAPPEIRTSDMAIASLVLGTVGLCGITGLAGLILGLVSRSKIDRSGGRLRGRGLAVAGIWVSSVMLLFSVPFMAVLLPAVARVRHQAARFSGAGARERVQVVCCKANLSVLAATLRGYAASHTNQLPPAATWCDAIQGNVISSNFFVCMTEPRRPCAYAFNRRLGGKKANEMNSLTVMLFESDRGWNGCGGPEALKPHKHSSLSVNVAFADGSVEAVPLSRLRMLRWDP